MAPFTDHPSRRPRVVAVVVTHERPALLSLCLFALATQVRPPDLVIVVDNASGPETARVLADFPAVQVLSQPRNMGGAAGYRVGIGAAMQAGAEWVWLMDDDGRPRDGDCLAGLLAAAGRGRAELAAPLVLDVEEPERLAFPLRLGGRTHFHARDVASRGDVPGFAHLFNGALISTTLLRQIGLPEHRFVIRGDEVEFLLRARRARARIVMATDTHFLHPSSRAEIHPILAGLYYATLPTDANKQFYQFRNRAWILRHYGLWSWLAADVLRYLFFWLGTRKDLRGLSRWIAASWHGLRGDFMREELPETATRPRDARAPADEAVELRH